MRKKRNAYINGRTEISNCTKLMNISACRVELTFVPDNSGTATGSTRLLTITTLVAGDKLKGLARRVAEIVKNSTDKLVVYEKYIDEYNELYVQYGPYRRYAALAAACSLLLVRAVLN